MTTEQLQGIVWLILGIIFGVAFVYSMKRQKFKFPTYRVWLLFMFLIMFVVDSFEGHTIGVWFVWSSGIILIILMLDVLESLGKKLNEKLAISSVLIVTSVGGILANVYVFSMPTSVGARIFSVSTLILVHVPILFALIALLKGKKELSKKLIDFGYFEGHEK